MRLVAALGVALAWSVVPGPLMAQARIGIAPSNPPSTQPAGASPLQPNEVLFEVQVTGVTRSPADQVMANVNFTTVATTAERARAQGEDVVQRLVEAARRFGAERVRSDPQQEFPGAGFGGDSLMVYGPGGGEDGETRSSQTFSAAGALRFRLAEPGRFAELRAALEQGGALSVTGPIFVLNDDTSARRTARLDAMRQAREEAELFARAQHMRVVRLIRFSEDPNGQAQMMRIMLRQFGGSVASAGQEVETSVGAQVAFALAPE